LTLRRVHVMPRLAGMRDGARYELIGHTGLAVRWFWVMARN
jgi:hypothetical protein